MKALFKKIELNDTVKKNSRHLIEFYFIGLTILLYLFRTSIPLLKFPFLFMSFGMICYTISHYRKLLIINLKEFIKNYYLILFLIIIFIYSFLFTNKIYLSVFKDVLNSIILLSFFILLTIYIYNKNDLNLFIISLLKFIIVFALIISLNNLYYLLNIDSWSSAFSSNEHPLNIPLQSDEVDYNFAIIPVIFGIVGLIYILIQSHSLLEKTVYNLLLIIYTICIFFSGSRRGLFALVVIVILLFLCLILKFFIKNTTIRKIGSSSFYFLLSLCVLIIFAWYFTYNSSYVFKNKTLKFIGSKNIEAAKRNISRSIFRYSLVRGKNNQNPDMYDIIWSPVFNPKDPDSNWGTRIHKTIFPLTGDNVNIVPNDAKGYLMDSTCNASSWSGNAFSFTYIKREIKIDSTNIVKSSVYCYVSKNFNGSWIRIISGGKKIGIVNGNDYDLSNKGTWQKLTCCVYGTTKDEVNVFLYFSKSGVTDFSTLKGYVIFAYPTVESVLKSDSVSSYNDINKNRIGTALEFNLNRKEIFGIDDRVNACYVNPHQYITAFQKNTTNNVPNTVKYYEAGFTRSLFSLFFIQTQLIKDHDPIRILASKIISSDTTYYGYKSELYVDTIGNKFIENRVMGVQFALQIFLKEYNWTERVFGGGFNFLNWYGYYFFKDKTAIDYPHNPFLYILLYSGLFGLFLYCYLMYKIFYLYIKYIKEYPYLFIFFLIIFVFSFFSGGSPFDPPIMGFFAILPFFIHSIHQKEKNSTKSELRE
jgi:hypothetical protein